MDKLTNKEIDDIIDELNSGKYESSLASIFDDLKKNEDLMSAVEKIFETSTSLDELQGKIILLIVRHAKELAKEAGSDMELDPKKIARDVAKLSRGILEEKHDVEKELGEEAPELKGVKFDKRDKYRHITGKARENFKTLLKNLAMYEVYKVMNPKRIAGETKKDNYVHNRIIGGQKLAGKYEGGRPGEIGSSDQKLYKQAGRDAVAFKKGGGFER